MLASAHHVGLVGGLLVAALAAAVAHADDLAQAKESVSRLGRRSVFFGHQSVGMNLLDGLQLLAGPDGGGLRVVDVGQGGSAIPAGTIGHAFVGRNHDPVGKLEAFARAVDALPAPGVDVALVKFCYVDFTAETDGGALAARYQATLEELGRRHPRTTFVPVTAPVSTVQGGPKALAKRLLGRAPYGLVENVRREEFNAALRLAYQGRGPFFDLAKVESTAPDGRAETVTWQGRVAPALVPAYTDDDGHLNREGRIRAARELLAVLAAIPERPPAAQAPAVK